MHWRFVLKNLSLGSTRHRRWHCTLGGPLAPAQALRALLLLHLCAAGNVSRGAEASRNGTYVRRRGACCGLQGAKIAAEQGLGAANSSRPGLLLHRKRCPPPAAPSVTPPAAAAWCTIYCASGLKLCVCSAPPAASRVLATSRRAVRGEGFVLCTPPPLPIALMKEFVS